jgi:hypothetical protein
MQPLDAPRCGVKLVVYGIESWFLPWWWDGSTVWWLPGCDTEAAALRAAEAYAEHHTN